MFKLFTIIIILVMAIGYVSVSTSWGQKMSKEAELSIRGITPITEILSSPQEFHGKEVMVQGVASGSMGLIGRGMYKVTGESGSIMVSTKYGLPATGQVIQELRGIVSQYFSFKGKTLLVIKELDREANIRIKNEP